MQAIAYPGARVAMARIASTKTLLRYAESTGSMFHVRLSAAQRSACAPLGKDITRNRSVARHGR
jgi:hypothetical protein